MIARRVMISVLAAILLLPLWYLVAGSFEQPVGLMKMPPDLWPIPSTLQNYRMLFLGESLDWDDPYALPWRPPIARWFLNTVVLGSGVGLVSSLVAVAGGYALAQRPRGHKLIASALFGAMVFPTMAMVIPRYLVLTMVRVNQGMVAAGLPLALSALCTLFARATFANLGPGYFEEARMAGAGELRTMLSVGVPMARAVIGVNLLFNGLAVLQDFLWQSLVLPDELRQTLVVGLIQTIAMGRTIVRPSQIGLNLAAASLLLVPMFAVFAIGHRWFTGDGRGIVL